MKKIAFAAAFLALAGTAMAQNILTASQGVTTIVDSTGKTLQTVGLNSSIPEGSIVSTTQAVTISVGNGACTFSLNAGQTAAVTLQNCQAIVARSGAGIGGQNLALGIAGLAGSVIVLQDINRKAAPISNN